MLGSLSGKLRCSYIRCKRKLNKNTLHRFPFNNPALMKQWIENMHVKGFVLDSDSALCDAHFKLNCFDSQARLRPDAVPTVFSSLRKEKTMAVRRKSKYVVQAIRFYKNFLGKTEKECNKCGFASFSLHVLYMHKYACEGKLIGSSMICCHCKRRFNFFDAYYKHKSTCVRNHRKKKYWQNKKKVSKEQRKKNELTISNDEHKKRHALSCSFCNKTFSKIRDYKAHKLSNMCRRMINNKHKNFPSKAKCSFSARKTLSNSKCRDRSCKLSDSDLYYDDRGLEAAQMDDETAYLHSLQTIYKNCFECTHCKNLYASKKLLFIHLEENYNCAEAYYLQNSVKTNYQHSARKSLPVVARKSFTSFNAKSYRTPLNTFRNNVSHSARKSMWRSTNAVKSKEYNSLQSSHNIICPVCLQQFSNSFNLFHHQRKANHWGKATKSISSICKCPFCDKEFLSVITRNSHLRTHSDLGNEVYTFLKDTTCEICSQHFSTESSKLQHIKLEHSSQSVKFRKSLCKIKDWDEEIINNHDEDEQKNVDKHKLFQDMMISESLKMQMKKFSTKCPICKSTFAKVYNRNRHLRIHLLQDAVECKLCHKKCIKVDLKNHIQELHSEKLEFQCAKCKKQFETKLQALQHAARSHPILDSKELVLNLNDKSNSVIKMINNEFYCDICEISFVKLNSLQRHRQTKFHRETLTKNLDKVRESLSNLPPTSSPTPEILCKQPEILSCSECAEEFTSVIDFAPHRLSHFSSKTSQNEITELNPYTCEVCSKIIDNHQKVQFHLFGHLQSQTSTENESIASKADPIVPDRLSGQHVAKKSFSDKVKNGSQEIVIDGIKKPLFTCNDCNVSFTTKYHYTNHIRRCCTFKLSTDDNKVLDAANKRLNSNKSSRKIRDSNINQDKVPDDSNSKCFISSKCVQCKICKCVFSGSDMFEEHIDCYCNSSYKDDSKLPDDENRLDLLRSLIDGECIVAGCVRCGFPFDNLSTLTEHMIMHKTKQVTNNCEPVSENLDVKHDKSKLVKMKEKTSDENNVNENDSDLECSYNMSSGNVKKDDSTIDADDPIPGIDETRHDNTVSDEISAKLDALRKNFSRLLYVLISDPELMEQLGYGDKVIDEVLINVLQQMGETPFYDESNKSELDNLRKNIQILLDICLKENVMEIIADGQTSLDNVVIEALKMLTSEEAQPMEEKAN